MFKNKCIKVDVYLGRNMQEQAPYLLNCAMRVGEIAKLLQMIATHPELSGVDVTVNPKRSTFLPSQEAIIKRNQVLVTIKLPRTTDMPSFFGNFSKALNQKK